jgi:O-antigen/teichoic acid export membrane protein
MQISHPRELLRTKRQSLFRVLSLFRGGQNDICTEQGRSAERYRRAAVTAASSVLARVLSSAAGVVSVPLAITYLGTERYGLWMAISSVVAMLGLADMGMGNGLLNAISTADGKSDEKSAIESVSSAFLMLTAVAAAILVIALVVNPVLPWQTIFKVRTALAAGEVRPTVLVLAVCVALNLPLGIVDKVQIGFQEGFRNNLWQSASALLGLGSIIAAIHFRGGLPLLVAAIAGAPTLARAANWIVQFTITRPWLRPSLRSFDRRRAAQLTKTGSIFFILNLLMIIGYSSDGIIIAHYQGPSALATYAVVQKLFFSTAVSEFLIAPLWPAFGEAIARDDYGWIRRTIRRSLILNFALTALIGIPLVIYGRQLVAWWTVSKILAPVSLLVSFAVLRMLMVYQGTLSVFLNHGDMLRKQLGFFSLASLCSIALKVVLVKPLGEAGVVWATVAGFGLLYVWPAARLTAGYLAGAQRQGGLVTHVPGGRPLCE